MHKNVRIRFSTKNRFSIRRLKIEASLKRWRRYSIRYSRERQWVERWLHMIDRALTRQPAAAAAIVETATMVQGYGDAYRHGLADWHAIIDGLAKPTFDGVLALPDLAGAIAEARAAALPDPRQAALKRKIAEIRARGAGCRRGGGIALQLALPQALCAVLTTTTLSSCGASGGSLAGWRSSASRRMAISSRTN